MFPHGQVGFYHVSRKSLMYNFCSAETSLSQDDSPNRDPLIVRNRFEGLLEGAMQMYTGREDVPTELPSKFEYKRKESRGKSAR